MTEIILNYLSEIHYFSGGGGKLIQIVAMYYEKYEKGSSKQSFLLINVNDEKLDEGTPRFLYLEYLISYYY